MRATLCKICGDPIGAVRAAAVSALSGHVDDADVRTIFIRNARRQDGWGSYYAIKALTGRGDDEDVRDALLFAMGVDLHMLGQQQLRLWLRARTIRR